MHLEIKQSTDRTETVSAQTIDKLYQLAFEDQSQGITSQLDATSDVQGRIEAPSAYEDAVRYLAGIDPGDTKRFQNLYITIPNQNYYIRFKDPIVKRICESNWGDGVGLTVRAASQVTSLNGVFNNASDKGDITSFNEFKYFTGLQDYGGQFVNMPKLKEITCPAVPMKLNGNILFNQVGNDQGNAFVVNWNGGTVYYDGTYVAKIYEQCTNLDDSINIFPTQQSFRYIRNDLYGGKGIYLCERCTNLTKVVFPEGYQEISFVPRNNTSLQYVEFPSTITWLGTWRDWGRDNGHRVAAVVIKATTPPLAWAGDINNSSQALSWLNYASLPLAIYVPDSAVNTYKSQTDWSLTTRPDGVPFYDNSTEDAKIVNLWSLSEIQSLIKPLSELPQTYRDMGTVTQADIDRV